MDDKSRMARSPRPRNKPGPRRRTMKPVSAPNEVHKLNTQLTHSPPQPKASLTALPPPYPLLHAGEVMNRDPPPQAGESREGGAPQPAKGPHAAPSPEAETQPPPAAAYPYNIDVEALTKNAARLIEEGGRAVAPYLRPRENGAQKIGYSDEIADAVRTLGQVAEYWYADPQRTVEIQTRLGKSFLDLFANTSRRLAGEPADPVVKPDPRDKRF